MITRVEGAVAVCRRKGGMIGQFDCYTYQGKLYVKVSNNNYARISSLSGGYYLTTSPDITVLEFCGVEPNDYG